MGVRVRRSPEGFDQIPCDEGVVDCSHHLWKRFLPNYLSRADLSVQAQHMLEDFSPLNMRA